MFEDQPRNKKVNYIRREEREVRKLVLLSIKYFELANFALFVLVYVNRYGLVSLNEYAVKATTIAINDDVVAGRTWWPWNGR